VTVKKLVVVYWKDLFYCFFFRAY
jgi:amino acid permease